MPVYDQYSDEQLVAAACDEDLYAWEAFLRRQGQRLLAFYTRMTGDEELSRELWVRSFNELWKQRATLTRGGKAVTAVFTLATRLSAKVSAAAPERGPKGDPASLASRSAGLRRALLGIPVRPRAALCLCYFDNVGFKEAERCLGAAPGEARQLCAEGYAALTRALGPNFLNDGLA